MGRVAAPWRAVGLAVALGGSGVLHLVRPAVYEWLVPPELGDARGKYVGFLRAVADRQAALVARWQLVGLSTG